MNRPIIALAVLASLLLLPTSSMAGSPERRPCPIGYADCDGRPNNGCEVNIQTDVNNCGACGTVCSFPNATSACVNSTCQVSACSDGYGDCDANPANGCETNVQSNVSNCGACGRVCSLPNATSACENSSCRVSACSATYSDCDGDPANGCESDIRNDPRNCGECGRVCQLPNAITGCLMGSCTIAACSAGYQDCNGMPQDGCEVRANSCP
jgi:hypothetical protein